jgi:aminoglycoside phosphotransferase (APT) family kinase protein
MPGGKMHVDEVETSPALVRRLLAEQFPQWADLPITPVSSAGTDNALYRLGDHMAVRLPRIGWAVEQVEKEQRWLSILAPHLPLPIPVPLAKGEPGENYPWHWSVYRWLEGKNATTDPPADTHQAATAIVQFISALQQIDAADGPPAGAHNSYRGVPLIARDPEARQGIADLRGMIDTETAAAAWDAALSVPAWSGQPVWLHGDLQSGNLLVHRGQISAVIDFGCLGVGDPACDLQIAWNFFSADTRDTFRAALAVDDATWARGRGWALYFGLVALPYYHRTNPVLASIARRALTEALTDFARGA